MDVLDRLVGQERATSALRAHLERPVHAYLFHGPAGSNIRDAMLSFAASLQCPRGGCGACDVCRQVLDGVEPDVIEASRSGTTWLLDDVHEIERVARRRPLSCPYVVILVNEVDLMVGGASPSAPALLKTLEEPPSRTIFLLGSTNLPEELVTVVSRCVEIPLDGLNDGQIEQILIADGVTPTTAALSAQASGGDLERARRLAHDPGVAQRYELWASLPDRFDGTAAGAMTLVDAVHGAIDSALAPLEERQAEELRRRTSDADAGGRRGGVPKAEMERRHRRESRRVRTEELRFGIVTLTRVFRERMVVSLDSPDSSRNQQRLATSLDALTILDEAYRRTFTTMDEVLLLSDLLLALGRL